MNKKETQKLKVPIKLTFIGDSNSSSIYNDTNP